MFEQDKSWFFPFADQTVKIPNSLIVEIRCACCKYFSGTLLIQKVKYISFTLFVSGNVWSRKVSLGISGQGDSKLGNCLIEELSDWGIAWSVKCLVWELVSWGTVQTRNFQK